MESKSKFYYSDYIVLMLFAVAHSMTMQMGLDQSPLVTNIWTAFGFSFWSFSIWYHLRRTKNKEWSFEKAKKVSVVGFSFLFLSYILAPIFHLFDLQSAPFEGAISFSLLVLSLQPFRYVVDSLKKEPVELSILKEAVAINHPDMAA